MIEDRPWDSAVTGYRCGTVVNLADLRHRAVWQHLVAFSDADDWPRIRSLEAEGFKLVGCRVEFVREDSGGPYPTLWPARDEDFPEIVAHAERAFTRSRFHADPLLAPKAAEIHRRWIESCRARKTVYTVDDEEGQRGYVCVEPERDAVRVALIGSLGSKPVGARMLWGAHGIQQQRRTVRAKTQAGNRAACRMYERAGFLVESADVVHSWSPGL